MIKKCPETFRVKWSWLRFKHIVIFGDCIAGNCMLFCYTTKKDKDGKDQIDVCWCGLSDKPKEF